MIFLNNTAIFDDNAPLRIFLNAKSNFQKFKKNSEVIHEAVEIKYFLEGESTLMIDDQTYLVKQGDIVVVNPYTFHTTINCGTVQGKYHLFMISLDFFDNTDFPDLRHLLLLDGQTVDPHFPADSNLKNIILRIVQEYSKKGEYYNTMIQALMMELFLILIREHSRKPSHRLPNINSYQYYNIVEPALHIIRNEYMDNLTVEKLSAVCNVNKYYFCRIFKELTGKSPIKYLNEYRLKIANTMLKRTNNSMVTIATQCGFGTQSYFCRCYKDFFGFPPMQERKNQ